MADRIKARIFDMFAYAWYLEGAERTSIFALHYIFNTIVEWCNVLLDVVLLDDPQDIYFQKIMYRKKQRIRAIQHQVKQMTPIMLDIYINQARNRIPKMIHNLLARPANKRRPVKIESNYKCRRILDNVNHESGGST
jgi:hypothetical protein